MRPLSELKQDFEISTSLSDIIDVLKTAALIQFRLFQNKEKLNHDFITEIETIFSILRQKKTFSPYFFKRRDLPSCIVVVTSDEGFLGELTTLLINASIDLRKSAEDEIIVLGERGAKYLEDIGQHFLPFPGLSDEVNFNEVERLRDYLLKRYKEKISEVVVVYPKFLSLTSQRVTVLKLLPYLLSESRLSQNFSQVVMDEMLFEPSLIKLSESVVKLWLGFRIEELFWSSKQAEFAARIMHLEGSTQELNLLKQKLSFEYFRQIHGLRDKVIREISASKILLNKR